MSVETEMLGWPPASFGSQDAVTGPKEMYDRLNSTMIPWADGAQFQSKTSDGRLIGPFNPILYSPVISKSFMDLHDAEEKYTSLNERARQVVILAVGAALQSDYERYAHEAAARIAGISEDAIRTLATGGLPDDLSDQEKIAQRYARQLSVEHRVDVATYSAAEHAFGRQGLVEITYLVGIYHIVCSLLNAFEVPVPDQKL